MVEIRPRNGNQKAKRENSFDLRYGGMYGTVNK